MKKYATPQERIEHIRRSQYKYRAKKLGITIEEYEKRIAATKELREKQKAKRAEIGYTYTVRKRNKHKSDFAHLELKEKWKDFEGVRLEKSEKPPIFLSSDLKAKYAARAST